MPFNPQEIRSILRCQTNIKLSIMKRDSVIRFLFQLRSAIVMWLFILTGINLYFFSIKSLFEDFRLW